MIAKWKCIGLAAVVSAVVLPVQAAYLLDIEIAQQSIDSIGVTVS